MDRSQFTSLVKQHQNALRRFLVALCCGDSAAADDIAQDAFIKAYVSLDKLADDDRFVGWLYRISYNCFINSRRNVRESYDIEAVENMVSSDSADANFRYQPLYQALARLSYAERNAILLYYMQGYSVKEIAALSSTTDDAVRQQLSRGRVHLRNLIK